VGEQLVLEGREQLADERFMSVSREGVVGEQQQPVMRLITIDSTLVASDEVWDVVGDDGSALLGSVVEQDAVVYTTKMFKTGILDCDDVVVAGTELLGHGHGDHLVEQQPHSSRACSTS
jgi:hypothetical protein